MFHHTKEESIDPFNELILTWNGKRPEKGDVNFYVRLKTDQWSPYLLYATWGAAEQYSHQAGEEVRVYQDVISTIMDASGYEIKVEGANLDDYRFHVFVNHDKPSLPRKDNLFSVELSVPSISQRLIHHPRNMDLCSPTSTAAVVEYLSDKVDLISFAKGVWDSRFDIYGNWILNLAHASTYLGELWDCWVERLGGFHEIHDRLLLGTPVIVSVRGPLVGSALPYAKGHLLVVRGYDSVTKRVLCMDPAFATNEETSVSYPLQDFVDAWERRGFISYIFEKRTLDN